MSEHVFTSTGFVWPDPSTWVAGLRDDHARRIDGVAYHITQLVADQESIPEVAWRVLIKGGIVETAIDILCDEWICGFTKEELTHPPCEKFYENIFMPYFIDVFSVFTSSLPYLKCRWEHSQHSLGDKRTCEECKAHEGIVTALEFGYATFLRKLWEVADPLILDWAAYTSPHDWPTAAFKLTFQHAFDMCQGLFLCLFDEVPDDERERMLKPMFRTSYISLLLWLNSEDMKVCQHSLYRMMLALDVGSGVKTPDPYTKWLEEVTRDGVVEKEEIYVTVIHDIKCAEEDLFISSFDLYNAVVKLVLQLRPKEMVNVRPRIERAVLWYTMAAARRHLCQTKINCDHAKKHGSDELSTAYMCMYLCKVLHHSMYYRPDGKKPDISEFWLHAMIPMFSTLIVYSVPLLDFLQHSRGLLWPALCEINRIFRYYQLHPTPPDSRLDRMPPSLSARRFSHKSWQEAEDTLVRSGISRRTRLNSIHNEWIKIGQELERGMNAAALEDVEEPPAEILKRCSWGDCACSVYAPVHRLRVCTTCYMAAYCSIRCQKGDWAAHKRVCSGRRSKS